MWYVWFTALCVVLAAFGASHRRSVWAVLAAASLASMLMGVMLDGVDSACKLLAYAALEVVTVRYLLSCQCRTLALWQASACVLAWCSHVLLFIDVEAGTSAIYENYESAILLIAALQLIPAADEFNALRRAVLGGRSLRAVLGLAMVATSTHGAASGEGCSKAQKT